MKMTRYILGETAVSVGINAAISVGFVFAQFHGMAVVPKSGPGGLIRDAVPQTFAISLMSVLVPTLLTRKRGRSQSLSVPIAPRRFTPWNVVLRALLIATVASACGLALHYAIFEHATSGLSFVNTLRFKACYGALVALTVTPSAVYLALHDVAMKHSI